VICFLLAGTLSNAKIAIAEVGTKADACAKCIGDLCMRPKQISDAELVNRYGPGEKTDAIGESNIVDNRTRCYFDATQKLWVLADIYHNNNPPHMYVVGLHVSTQPLCKNAVPPKKPFSKLSLKTGLYIGDGESDVLKQCGNPNRIDQKSVLGVKYGELDQVYFPEGEVDSLLMLSVHIVDGKVVTLWLNDSP
jgi:hypothetical protein